MIVRKPIYFSIVFLPFFLLGWNDSHSIDQYSKLKNTYRIMYNDNQIGVLKAQKQQTIATTHYLIQAEVTADLLKTFHITYKLSVQFDTGSMVKAFTKTAVNQNTWDSTYVQWQNNKYRIKKEGKAAYYKQKSPCAYATACLYFKKPPSKKVFSEQYTQTVQIKEIKPDVYKMKLPSGNANYYHYDKQGLKKVVVNDTPVQIRFIRL